MAWTKYSVLALLLLASLSNAQNDDTEVVEAADEDDSNNIEVETYLGPVIGQRVDTVDDDGEEGSHFEFLGIPYAEPPTDKLRFQDPVPKKPWHDPVDAQEYGMDCPQAGEQGTLGDEDCLTLNVYSPRIPTRKGGRALTRSYLLPVMVWIHPGSFASGSGRVDPSPLLDRDIVVVSMNYRLGALGFLNLNQPNAPGNMGLKDQVLALRWVKNNIALFGGDPEKITLAGYGGATHMHQVSPQGRGLYQGVIAQGSSALSGFLEAMEDRVVPDESFRLAKNLGCTGEKSPVVECLQNKDVDELLANPDVEDEERTEIEYTLDNLGPYFWLPSIDGRSPSPFLPEHPYITLINGRQKDLPLIAGFGENDGQFMVDIIAAQLDDISGNWSFYGPAFVLQMPINHINLRDDVLANVTRKHYIGDEDISLDVEDGLTKMFTNIVWRAPLLKAMMLQSSGQQSPVFVYERTYDLTGGDSRASDSDIPANNFFSDFGFLFGSLDDRGTRTNVLNEEDREVADMMVYMWTNFVKYGVPTPFEDKKLPTWEPYNVKSEKYLDINPEPEMKERMKEAEYYFWQKMYFADKDTYYRGRSLATPATSNYRPLPVVHPLSPSIYKPLQSVPSSTAPASTSNGHTKGVVTHSSNAVVPRTFTTHGASTINRHRVPTRANTLSFPLTTYF